jgi:pyrroline-5-carboxylate reductase
MQRQPIILSIAAGIRIHFIKQHLSQGVSVIRCMPNTPALVLEGMSALYASKEVSPEARSLAETVVNAVGTSLWLDNEDQMDAVTALSGSGPAYFYYIMEALIQAGISLGLKEQQAGQLCLQTAKGAAQMAIQSKQSLSELRRRVTSPGGTTAAAIEIMQHNRMDSILTQALLAAHARSAELAKLFGDTA